MHQDLKNDLRQALQKLAKVRVQVPGHSSPTVHLIVTGTGYSEVVTAERHLLHICTIFWSQALGTSESNDISPTKTETALPI
jgi:hypothetical protein